MIFADARQGVCFKDSRTGAGNRLTCENPMAFNLTKKQCCCSIGAAWGLTTSPPCSACPKFKSSKKNYWFPLYQLPIHQFHLL